MTLTESGNILRPTFPFRVSWDVTHKCNLSCRHCFVIHQKNILPNISRLKRKKIAQKISEAKPFIVSVAGGEPTLLQDIVELLRILESRDTKIVLATNGVVDNLEIIAKLREIRNLSLQVSIDSYDEAKNDKIRGHGSFNKSLRFVENISHQIPVTIAMTLTRDSIFDISGVVDMCQRLGVSALKIQQYIETSSTQDTSLKPTRTQIEKASNLLSNSIAGKNLQNLKIMHPFTEVKGVGILMEASCQSILGETECTVLPNGDVVGCGANIDNYKSPGNLLESSLLDIWNSIDLMSAKNTCLSDCKCI